MQITSEQFRIFFSLIEKEAPIESLFNDLIPISQRD